MVKGDKPRSHIDSSFRQPQTPANSTTRSEAATVRAATTTKAKKRTQSPTYSIQSSFKSRKSDIEPDWKQQATLTQIDFVTRTPGSGLHEELDYIENNGDKGNAQKKREVIELDDDSENGAATFRPTPLPRVRRARAIRFEDEVRGTPAQSRSREKSTSRRTDSIRKKTNTKGSSRSKGDGKVKSGKKDKTLTQMDFVRRFCVIESSDDDLNLNYIRENSKDNTDVGKSKSRANDTDPTQDEQPSHDKPPEKKRKLNESLYTPVESSMVPTQGDGVDALAKNSVPMPVTPQKPGRTEIPSSQSPESPGFAVISSSQFVRATATRSPLKHVSPNSSHGLSQTRQDPRRSVMKASQSPVHISLQSKTTILESPIMGDSVLLSASPSTKEQTTPIVFPSKPELDQETEESLSEYMHSGTKVQEPSKDGTEDSGSIDAERLVVYETDAETEYSDLDDDSMLRISDSGHTKTDDGDNTNVSKNGRNPTIYNSDDPPPPVPNSGTDLEGGDTYTSDFNVSSQASVYYKRQLRSTQFPDGPVPVLSTQKMAELFPRDDSTQQARVQITSVPLSSQPNESIPQHSSPRTPKRALIETQTQTPTPTQSQSEKHRKSSTQLVPESSPLVPCTDVRNFTNNSQTQSNHPVVLVESSQPVDKLHKLSNSNQMTSQKGVIPASRWLTDSVMESIPPPPPWMSSQDSIGEPYSLPES